jgi:predicted transcriptional regulator
MSTPVAVDPAVIADSNDEARLAPQQVSASEVLFGTVRDLMPRILVSSMKCAEIADVLGVSKAQAKVWLKRLVDEGVIRQQRKPAGYVLSKDHLFRKTGLCAKESSSSESAP